MTYVKICDTQAQVHTDTHTRITRKQTCDISTAYGQATL